MNQNHLKAVAKDSRQTLCTNIQVTTPVESEEYFEALFLESIRNNCENTECNKLPRNWPIIEALGAFLGIDDYKTNLFSCWILRTLAQLVLNVSNTLNESDYKNYIFWILDVIDIMRDRPDMTRKEFFVLMNKMFHQVLSEILSGQDLSFPSHLISLFSESEGEEFFTNSKISENDNGEPHQTSNYDLMYDSSNDVFEEDSRKYSLETLLHCIVDAIYEIFGPEPDYMLVQYSIKSDSNVLNYNLPYHYRKPKVVKKAESKRKMSSTSARQKKKKKETAKKVVAEDQHGFFVPTPQSSTSSIDQSRYVLPLSEAIESYDAVHAPEHKNEQTEIIDE